MMFTDASSISTPMMRIAKMAGQRTAETTFTSRLKTIAFTSEHLGVPNQKLIVSGFALRMVPQGSGTVTIAWEMDHGKNGSETVTFDQNLGSEKVMGTDFYVTTDPPTDGAKASYLASGSDEYVYHTHNVDATGKFFEVEISISDELQLEITGMEIDMKPAGKAEAYV